MTHNPPRLFTDLVAEPQFGRFRLRQVCHLRHLQITSRSAMHICILIAILGVLALTTPGVVSPASAQGTTAWPNFGPTIALPETQPGTAPPADAAPLEAPAADGNTTVVPRKGEETDAAGDQTPAEIKLVALLTEDGQRIDQGLVWRVFRGAPEANAKNALLSTHREASPTLKLSSGDYVVNAAFGRAHLTRKITVKPGTPETVQFVLNAGGLRVAAVVGGKPAPPQTVSYGVYSDERDQAGNRATIMTGAKPGLIIRLNAGIYHVVSTYGDANASVDADVTVEAGKLTEAAVAIAAAKVTFKLVTRTGGEALPDTRWIVATPQGEVVKQSAGALPTHVLAPGTYRVTASSGSKSYRRDFTVENGDATQVEVVMQ